MLEELHPHSRPISQVVIPPILLPSLYSEFGSVSVAEQCPGSENFMLELGSEEEAPFQSEVRQEKSRSGSYNELPRDIASTGAPKGKALSTQAGCHKLLIIQLLMRTKIASMLSKSCAGGSSQERGPLCCSHAAWQEMALLLTLRVTPHRSVIRSPADLSFHQHLQKCLQEF